MIDKIIFTACWDDGGERVECPAIWHSNVPQSKEGLAKQFKKDYPNAIELKDVKVCSGKRIKEIGGIKLWSGEKNCEE